MSQQQSMLDTMSSKASFTFGLVTGLAAFSLLGFGFFVFGGASLSGLPALAKNTNTNAQVAPTPTPPPSPSPTPTPSAPLPEVTDADWVRGDLNTAEVVLVEYSDFECPFCSRHHPSMQQVMEQFGDKVAWVYRHFPLSFHQEAAPSALASECVGEQLGDQGFWQFADAMFANQSILGTTLYEQTAEQLGADMTKYRDCVSSEKYASKISNQMNAGGSAGVTGTPGTFVNGQLVSGAVPAEQLLSIVQSMLQ